MPEPEPVEIAPGVWDARPWVSNPAGNGPMGVVVGQATHHTVTAMLPFDATKAQEIDHIKVIDAFHKSQGWGGFAYHGIAFASGRAYLCGDLMARRAHVAGRNHELHGCAFNGDFSNVLPPDQMLQAGANFLGYVQMFWGVHPIRGHAEWGTQTVCAGTLNGFDWTPLLNPPGPPTQPHVTFVKVGFSDGSEWFLDVKPPPQG